MDKRGEPRTEIIKKIIWSKIPYDYEIRFRALFDYGFRRKNRLTIEKLDRSIDQIESARKEGKIKIAFICNMPSAWSSCASVFLEAVNDPELNVLLIAIPSKAVVNNGFLCKENGDEKKRALMFCRSFFPAAIDGLSADCNLHELAPDYVILSRPYDEEVPYEFQSENLSQYTKIVYIPYSYCKMNWDARTVYNLRFLNNVYAVFTENRYYCEMLQKVYSHTFNAKHKKIYSEGYPRSALYHNKGPYSGQKQLKTVLWLPRWTTRVLLEPSTFFKYKEILLAFFKEHQEYQLICRPHPLMFDNFISTGELTIAEVADIRRTFQESDNLLLDETPNHFAAFDKADVFISDTSSLLIEELYTGKPIIFCGSEKHFDKSAKKWVNLMYNVGNNRELLTVLEKLLHGEDPRKQERNDYVANHFIIDKNIGHKIIANIKDDYMNIPRGDSTL